ncbi:hypothetical protein ACET3X_005760 [Alternaria dauci]|uniref:Uncharacterized protein n=1 Tax=Alternaria dauci TaxID=48095 RepID=A0ABR3UGB4_9PLEO
MGRILRMLMKACFPPRFVPQRQTTGRTDNLPFNTAEQFIANYLEDLTQCCICFEAFDQDKHTPTRFTGPNACGHVFGGSHVDSNAAELGQCSTLYH